MTQVFQKLRLIITGVTLNNYYSRFNKTSAYFNGNSYLSFNYPINSFSFNEDFTFECWIYLIPPGNITRRILTTDFISAVQYGNLIFINPSNLLVFRFSTVSAPLVPISLYGKTYIPFNTWTNIVICKNKYLISSYINGIIDNSLNVINDFIHKNTICKIGGESDTLDNFKGYIDEMRFTQYCKYNPNLMNISIYHSQYIDYYLTKYLVAIDFE